MTADHARQLKRESQKAVLAAERLKQPLWVESYKARIESLDKLIQKCEDREPKPLKGGL